MSFSQTWSSNTTDLPNPGPRADILRLCIDQLPHLFRHDFNLLLRCVPKLPSALRIFPHHCSGSMCWPRISSSPQIRLQSLMLSMMAFDFVRHVQQRFIPSLVFLRTQQTSCTIFDFSIQRQSSQLSSLLTISGSLWPSLHDTSQPSFHGSASRPTLRIMVTASLSSSSEPTS